ncbi:unnamed protein product [Notodromas monacha]|uniref:Uncharacterized protein n=1 Tax=Notodromas monacha TaxID=399045 RepID=A0A7R9BUV0_9CRUS|nr:unnamed protein product [Notodromas monacha]CAG0920799.1 unnamed protein product [Notodromas monacha]
MMQALTPPPPWQFNAFPKMNPQHLMALMQYRAFLARTQQGLRASMMYQRMMMPNHLMNSYAAPAAQTFMSHMSKAMGHPGQASPSYAYHDRNLARDGRRQEEPSEHLQDQRRHRPSPRQQQMPDRIRSPNRKPRLIDIEVLSI